MTGTNPRGALLHLHNANLGAASGVGPDGCSPVSPKLFEARSLAQIIRVNYAFRVIGVAENKEQGIRPNRAHHNASWRRGALNLDVKCFHEGGCFVARLQILGTLLRIGDNATARMETNCLTHLQDGSN